MITYREAVREAIREALEADDRVLVIGEDVGRYGGCYSVTEGLLDEFGPDRIRDAPLSELGYVGTAIGAALGGMRPIVEIMTVNFALLAMDQIVNTAALYLHMSGGQFNVPIVIRMATGAGRQLAAQHSHSLEGWFAHVPGLTVASPATVEDARWMLPAALDHPDPVLLFEHVSLYSTTGETGSGPADLTRARVPRSGTDVSIVTHGGCLPKALAAGNELEQRGISAEVVDLRMLRPLDVAALLRTVSRTHRLVIVDEGWKTGGFSAEIAARVAEDAIWELDAPIARVCTSEVPIPYAGHLESAALPQVDDIVMAAEKVVHG